MMQEMAGYLLGLINERRERPTDDLLSRLIEAEVDGLKLNDIEIVAHFAQLMAGGNETTRNAFAGGLLVLTENPAQRSLLLDDPALIGGAIEEIPALAHPDHAQRPHRHPRHRGPRRADRRRAAAGVVARRRQP